MQHRGCPVAAPLLKQGDFDMVTTFKQGPSSRGTVPLLDYYMKLLYRKMHVVMVSIKHYYITILT